MDTETRSRLKEVAAGKVEQFSITDLENMGLTGLESNAGRLDDDAIMEQAEQLLARNPDQTDVKTYAPISARGTIGDLRLLQSVADGDYYGGADEALESLGLDVDGGVDVDDAIEHLYEMPLAVERKTIFEIVLGTGGPHRELRIHCGNHDEEWEIERVTYLYAWSGSAEVELTGDDKETAEAFARRVVPELSE